MTNNLVQMSNDLLNNFDSVSNALQSTGCKTFKMFSMSTGVSKGVVEVQNVFKYLDISNHQDSLYQINEYNSHQPICGGTKDSCMPKIGEYVSSHAPTDLVEIIKYTGSTSYECAS